MQPQGTRYTGRYQYQKTDLITGEITEVGEFDEFITPAPEAGRHRRNNFGILYLMEFYCLLDELGNKKMQVVKFILENMNYENTLNMTAKEIAKKSGISYFTVKETLRKLEGANLITRKLGTIILNPHLLNRKNAQGEGNILVKYRTVKKEQEKKKEEKKKEDENIERSRAEQDNTPQEEPEPPRS